MKLELEQIAQWTRAGLWFAPGEIQKGPATGYSIDSRTLAPGDLFFAVHGERFDGHDFVSSAFERGARAAVVARTKLHALPDDTKQKTLLVAEDPLEALQMLA
jgi:UDP-N-acetylmuramoyl-tripeptide--D-alanyl-D-alanine ligase